MATKYSAKLSLPSLFYRALGKVFAECPKKKLVTRPDDGDGTFAECRNGKALGNDSNFTEGRIDNTRQTLVPGSV